MITKITPIKFPEKLKAAIIAVKDNMTLTKWVIEAVVEKLKKHE